MTLTRSADKLPCVTVEKRFTFQASGIWFFCLPLGKWQIVFRQETLLQALNRDTGLSFQWMSIKVKVPAVVTSPKDVGGVIIPPHWTCHRHNSLQGEVQTFDREDENIPAAMAPEIWPEINLNMSWAYLIHWTAFHKIKYVIGSVAKKWFQVFHWSILPFFFNQKYYNHQYERWFFFFLNSLFKCHNLHSGHIGPYVTCGL